MFKKILIANRGEIACRVIRTAQSMGIKCVAVYSSADAGALHVRMADEAVFIGAAPATESYLKIDKIIKAAKKTGAEAVHPGYGFLSENADFCRRLQAENITFIGPDIDAIEKMGDKIQSKLLADKAGVSTIPGHPDAISDPQEAVKIANKIGYPVMLKASAGGGGKGMRLAYNDDEAREGLTSAMNEARSSFGDDRVLIEKFIENPRHIEIQIIADKHGNVVYLGERECSLQRRHQKVIEEAPSPHIDPKTRKKMGDQAVKLAKAVNYCSAGTVEFVADKDRNFYFLEMNTRLQVEHPITEYITGVDLVELMLRVASGEKLPIKQSQIKLKGWAVESRIYAEDSKRGFLPSTGRLEILQPPQLSDNVRLDTGVVQGSEISVYYDPMIAKLISYGKDRKQAIARMRLALDQYVIEGLSHNIPFLSHMLTDKRILDGKLTTAFIGDNYPNGLTDELTTPASPLKHLAIAAVAYHADQNGMNGEVTKRKLVSFSADEKRHEIPIALVASKDSLEVTCGQGKKTEKFTIKADTIRRGRRMGGTINGKEFSARVHRHNHIYEIEHDGYNVAGYIFADRLAPYFRMMPHKQAADLSQFLLSPMPGILKSVAVQAGDKVKAGQALATIEAMKMENILKAEKDGTVKEIFVSEGASLMLDDKILSFEQ